MTATESVESLPLQPSVYFSWDEFACRDAVGTAYPLDWRCSRGVPLANELERLRMALKDNILTAEVRANGYGAVDAARLAKAIDQIALTYDFKNAKPKAADAFDASFLPSAADRKAN